MYTRTIILSLHDRKRLRAIFSARADNTKSKSAPPTTQADPARHQRQNTMLDNRAFLNHIFDPQPTIDSAIRKITVTEQQHDADEGNPATSKASTADGFLTHELRHGKRNPVGSGGEKGREGNQYNCTLYPLQDGQRHPGGVPTAHWQRGGQLQEQPRNSKTCFYCARPGTSKVNAHTTSESPPPSKLQQPPKDAERGHRSGSHCKFRSRLRRSHSINQPSGPAPKPLARR